MASLYRLSLGIFRPALFRSENALSGSLRIWRLLASETGYRERMESLVKKDKVVVFMKGTPDQPMCGFSNAVVQILRMHGVEEYGAYNVLDDQDLRQGVKDYSNWPTIPQVYFNGEFVGGCDILLQMHQNGDLVEELKKLGIKSALLEAEKGTNQ